MSLQRRVKGNRDLLGSGSLWTAGQAITMLPSRLTLAPASNPRPPFSTGSQHRPRCKLMSCLCFLHSWEKAENWQQSQTRAHPYTGFCTVVGTLATRINRGGFQKRNSGWKTCVKKKNTCSMIQLREEQGLAKPNNVILKNML